jgi:hypothetical protein
MRHLLTVSDLIIDKRADGVKIMYFIIRMGRASQEAGKLGGQEARKVKAQCSVFRNCQRSSLSFS